MSTPAAAYAEGAEGAVGDLGGKGGVSPGELLLTQCFGQDEVGKGIVIAHPTHDVESHRTRRVHTSGQCSLNQTAFLALAGTLTRSMSLSTSAVAVTSTMLLLVRAATTAVAAMAAHDVAFGRNALADLITGHCRAERGDAAEVKHEEFRDDRYVAALRLGRGASGAKVFYLVRAVTPGTYTVPPPPHLGQASPCQVFSAIAMAAFSGGASGLPGTVKKRQACLPVCAS